MHDNHQTESAQKIRKDTWNKFVNSRTPTKYTWDKFKKVNRNYKPRKIPPLERGGNTNNSPDEIVDTFADHYANISKNHHKKSKPREHRKRKKEEDMPYNKSFTDRELKAAVK